MSDDIMRLGGYRRPLSSIWGSMPGEFCPNCGAGRIGALRFCRSCGFDFDTSTLGTPPATQGNAGSHPAVEPANARPPTPVTQVVPSPQPQATQWTPLPVPPAAVEVARPAVRARTSPRALIGGGILLLVGAVVVASALSRPEGPSSAAADGSPTARPTATARPTPRATPRPTPTRTPATPTAQPAPEAPGQFVPGEVVTITADGAPHLDILVDKVSVQAKYDGEYLDDRPEVEGNVFIQARVTYTSLQNGASYNPFDWNVFVDDVAVDNYAFVLNGPEPELGSGDLPEGRTAQGWLVYEVPAKGKVVLSYRANMFTDDAPVFEVVLRAA